MQKDTVEGVPSAVSKHNVTFSNTRCKSIKNFETQVYFLNYFIT